MILTIFRFVTRTIPFIAVFLIVLEIVATNELAGVGQKIHEVDATIDTLQQENEILVSQVASASSIVAIETKAQSLGFTKPKEYVTMGQESVALNQLR